MTDRPADELYHGASDVSFAQRSETADPTPPAPARPITVTEPARETEVHAVTQVLVVGGGPAGCAAALAARRAGAEVLLVERYNHLGGLSTGGLVFWIDRMTDWTGTPVIAGVGAELLERLPAGALAGAAPQEWGSTEELRVAHWRERLSAFRGVVTRSPMVDPEWLKLVSMEALLEAGVKLLLHSWVVDAVGRAPRLDGVVFESKQGRRAVLAEVVIDCSGDLDVCRRAGAGVEVSGEGSETNVQHCLNTAWTWAGVDFGRWLDFKRADPDGHRELMERARESLGYVERPVVGWRDDVALFLGPRLRGYSGLEVGDLTRVEVESRRRMVEHLGWFRAHAPGFERAWITTTAPQVGVRHTGRAVGLARLSSEDWRAGVRHEDEIGVSPSPSQAFENVSVPYGALVPAELQNVLVAGRHIACDAQTQAFMREIPQCWMTGQAAGVAGALAAAQGRPPAELEVAEVQRELRRQGAYLRGAAAPEPSAAV